MEVPQTLLKLQKGSKKLTHYVGTTHGPKGRLVLYKDALGNPRVTKDGITVAKQVWSEDPVEQLGIQLNRNATDSANKLAGDGSTNTQILQDAIFEEGINAMQRSNKFDVFSVGRGIMKAVDTVCEYIDRIAEPAHTKDQKICVATIAANGDKEIGELVGTLIHKVGDAPINVEDSPVPCLESEIRKGLYFSRGVVSQYMLKGKLSAELPILLFNGTIDSTTPINEALTLAQNNNLLVICGEVTEEVLSAVLKAKFEEDQHVYIVKNPYVAEQATDFLQDIVAVAGGEVIDKFKSPSVLAHAKVVLKKDETTIYGDLDATKRISELNTQLNTLESEFDRMKLRSRIAALSNGIGIIKVGGDVEASLEEMKDRIEDAIQASKTALKGGIVPGGCMTLFSAKGVLFELSGTYNEELGIEILRASLDAPLKNLTEKAGRPWHKVFDSLDPDHPELGYDGNKDKFGVNLIKAGIVDSAEGLKIQLRIAAQSSATTLMIGEYLAEPPQGGLEEVSAA